MSKIRKIIFFIGRAFFSLMFIVAGIKKILFWSSAQESLSVTLCTLSMHFSKNPIFDLSLLYLPMLLSFLTFFELVGGLILISGYFIRLGAIFLLIFLVPSTIIYHHFWFQMGHLRAVELTMFMKNLTIIGGLLLLSLNPQFKKEKK